MFKIFNKKEESIDDNEAIFCANQKTKKYIIELIENKVTYCRNFKLSYYQSLGINRVINEIEEEYNVSISYNENTSAFTNSDTVELNIIYYNIEDIKEISKRCKKQLIKEKLNNIKKNISKEASEGYETLSVFIEENILEEVLDTLKSEGYEITPSLTKQMIEHDYGKSELWIISWGDNNEN